MEKKQINKNESLEDSKEKKDSFIRFDQLSWTQINQLSRRHTLFFLPISPLEEHGPHLPVGTDLLTAQDTAVAAMKQIKKNHPTYTCVLLPAIPLGFAGFNMDFPGTVSVSSRVVKNVLFRYGSMLANHGFRHLMICTYHMALGHLKGIYNAMNLLRRKYDMIICEPWSPLFYSEIIEKKEPRIDFDTSKEVHAGFRETSLMKYTHPSLVSEEYKKLPFVFNEKVMTPAVLFKSFKQLGFSDGYIGSPSKADASYGKWFFHFTIDSYVSAAEHMIHHKPLPDLPKKVKRRMKLLFWL